MGYYTYITGDATIAPALPEADLKDFGPDEATYLIAHNEGEEETVGLDANGNIAVIPGSQATVLTCRYEEPVKAYGIEEEVQLLANISKKAGAKMNGCIWLDGEESQDLMRIRIVDNAMTTESPELVWPDGSKGWGG